MNPSDPDQFEAELRSLRPARPPQTLELILAKLPERLGSQRSQPSAERPNFFLRSLCRWLVPTAAAATLAALLLAAHWSVPPKPLQDVAIASSTLAKLKADKVEIDRQLVANFDAIGQLPNGEPVRFRCEQWMDKIQLRDSTTGLVLERTTPRLEIVPVGFETY